MMRPVRPLLLVFALGVCAGAGCATSLGSTRTAAVLKPGHVEAHYGSGISLPVGLAWSTASAAFDAAKHVYDTTQQGQPPQLDLETAQNLGVAVAAFLLQPPSLVQSFDVRAGVVDRLDVGLRLSGSAVRLETFGQLHDSETWKVALGGGFSWFYAGGGIFDWLSQTHLASFSRFDVDAALLFGQGSDFVHVWFGPKVLMSQFQSSGILFGTERVQVIPGQNLPAVDLDVELGRAWMYGGVAGIRLGWKYLFVSAELGVFGSTFNPRILGRTFDLGGLILYPSLGIAGIIPGPELASAVESTGVLK